MLYLINSIITLLVILKLFTTITERENNNFIYWYKKGNYIIYDL